MTGRRAEDVLFLACTRPAMVLGVPMEAFGVNAIVTGVFFLLGGSLGYLLIAPAMHAIFLGLCRHDPNAFRILGVWLDTRGRCRDAGLWGGSSYAVLPPRRLRPRRFTGHG